MTHLSHSAPTRFPVGSSRPTAQDASLPMSPATYRDVISGWGLGVLEAGRFFGVSDGTARKMAVEGPSVTAEKLCKLMLAMDLRPEDVNMAIRRWEREQG